MIITFCGHADFQKTEEYEKRMLAVLKEKVGKEPAELYLGGYGRFDFFAYECCKKYKKENPLVSLIFVTPYITEAYQKNHLVDAKSNYDEIVYPPIEHAPLKYAILYHNKWMVEQADLLIACVWHHFGGAYQTYLHAKRKGKQIESITGVEP